MFRKSLKIPENAKIEKSRDIFDIWFDSGVAWSNLMDGNSPKQADLVVEGYDQFRGWFQSLLLSSVGVSSIFNDKFGVLDKK